MITVARCGAPPELGVLGLGNDDPVIIHALPLRAQATMIIIGRRLAGAVCRRSTGGTSSVFLRS
jgi:hypothetical protein